MPAERQRRGGDPGGETAPRDPAETQNGNVPLGRADLAVFAAHANACTGRGVNLWSKRPIIESLLSDTHPEMRTFLKKIGLKNQNFCKKLQKIQKMQWGNVLCTPPPDFPGEVKILQSLQKNVHVPKMNLCATCIVGILFSCTFALLLCCIAHIAHIEAPVCVVTGIEGRVRQGGCCG